MRKKRVTEHQIVKALSNFSKSGGKIKRAFDTMILCYVNHKQHIRSDLQKHPTRIQGRSNNRFSLGTI